MAEVSRRRLLIGAAGGGAAVAAGAIGVAKLGDGDEAQASEGLVEWRGPRQAGITTPRTDYGFVAAFDVVTDDLPELFQDLTARIAELTQGYPDRIDPIGNEALPPSDTGELGYDKRDDGRLTITVGLGASLFDRRFGLRGKRPTALRRMPSFPGDNLDPDRTHGDLLLIVQSDHMMNVHHATRDIMRRTKGRLEGRWAQPCFQRFDEAKARKPDTADARGILGFPDGTRNLNAKANAVDLFAGSEAPAWARGGTYVAVRQIRLKLERWDRLSLTAQENSIGRRKVSGGPMEGGAEQAKPKLGKDTPIDAHVRQAGERGDKGRIMRRGFSYTNGFDEYGLIDSGSMFMAYCRNVVTQFQSTKERLIGQDLDEYIVAIGGGYFFLPPGVEGRGDYLARRLVEG